jgi:hypothetical protein
VNEEWTAKPGPGTVRIEKLDTTPAPYSGGGSVGDPSQRHIACCPTEGEQGTRIAPAATAARTHSAADPATGDAPCGVKYSSRAPLCAGLPGWGYLSGSPTYTPPLGAGRRSGKGLRTLCQDEAGPLPVVAQAWPGAHPWSDTGRVNPREVNNGLRHLKVHVVVSRLLRHRMLHVRRAPTRIGPCFGGWRCHTEKHDPPLRTSPKEWGGHPPRERLIREL